MPDFSPEIQRMAETVSRRVMGDVLEILPEGSEARELGRDIGGDIATAFEDAALPAVYRRSRPQENTTAPPEPPFFSPERYDEFIREIEPSYEYDPDIYFVDTVNLRPRRIARAAFPQDKFLSIKANTVDAMAEGISEGATERIEARVKNLVVLGAVLGFAGGAAFALGFKKLYDA